MVVAHVLHQELIVIYKILSNLGFILEQQKPFEITQTLCLVHIMLIQLQNAERINSVWDIM